MSKIRVLVCGSRNWGDRSSIARRLLCLPLNTVVVHGAVSRKVDGVERSVDMIADDVARAIGFTVEPHPANWKEWPRTAGIIRNIEMLDSGIDRVIAFQRNFSRGTQHTINEARKRGIPVEVYDEP